MLSAQREHNDAGHSALGETRTVPGTPRLRMPITLEHKRHPQGAIVEITIGVQNLTREVTLDADITADEVDKALKAALASDGVLDLSDPRGRRIFVPARMIGYIEVGPEETRRVGFGSL
jgi:hypothetical protein